MNSVRARLRALLHHQNALTRISTVLGILATVAGVIAAGYRLEQWISDCRTRTREFAIDRAVAGNLTVRRKYSQAIKEYEKALTLYPNDSDTEKQIIDVLVRNACESTSAELNDILARLYRLRRSAPAFERDATLLVDEVTLFVLSRDSTGAFETVDKARSFHPDDPSILAELGELHMRKKTAEHITTGLDLLARATELAPDEGLYHYRLARGLGDAGRLEQALREYHRAANLDWKATVPCDVFERDAAVEAANRILTDFAPDPEDPSARTLDVPSDELIRIMEDVAANREDTGGKLSSDVNMQLATLYVARGDFRNAERALRRLMHEWHWAVVRSGSEGTPPLPVLSLLAPTLESVAPESQERAEARRLLDEALVREREREQHRTSR